MPSTQIITRRLKSVKSTRKVTRAMQMVSASKMRKTQIAAVLSRVYANLLAELKESLPKSSTKVFPLTHSNPKAQKMLVVVLSSNRGLVGSLNANLLVEIKELEKKLPALKFEYITYGKKASELIAKTGRALLADFHKDEAEQESENLYHLAKFITQKFLSLEYLEVHVAYNHFVSALKQDTRTLKVLPLSGHISSSKNQLEPELKAFNEDKYLLEPTAEKVLNDVLPRIFETLLKHCILENDASEHSARMMMMKNATDAAGDLISDLTLTFNQLRQNKITTELSEITAGKISLEN